MSTASSISLHALLNGLADLQFTLNSENRVSDISLDHGSVRNIARDDVVGRPWVELFRSSDAMIADEALRKAKEQPETAHRVDLALKQGADQEAIPMSCWLCSMESDQTMMVACIDLRSETNLRQQLVNAQRTLEQDYWSNRRLEARYRRMLEMVEEGFLVVDDLSGRVLEANSIASHLLCREDDALIGRVFPVGLDSAGIRTLTELQREARSTSAMVQGKVTTPNGETLELGVACLRQGNETRLLIRLVTTSPRTSDLSSGNNSFEFSPDGILVTDSDGLVIATNPAFLNMACIQDEQQATGRRADRWLGRSIVDLDVIMSNIRANRPVELFSSVLRTELGTQLDVEVSAAETKQPGGGPIFLFIRDVTRRITTEQATEVHLPRSIEQITGRVGRVPLKQLVRESTDVIEALCIEAALKLTRDNRAAAAELLGLSRQSLYTKLRRFDIGDSEDNVD